MTHAAREMIALRRRADAHTALGIRHPKAPAIRRRPVTYPFRSIIYPVKVSRNQHKEAH